MITSTAVLLRKSFFVTWFLSSGYLMNTCTISWRARISFNEQDEDYKVTLTSNWPAHPFYTHVFPYQCCMYLVAHIGVQIKRSNHQIWWINFMKDKFLIWNLCTLHLILEYNWLGEWIITQRTIVMRLSGPTGGGVLVILIYGILFFLAYIPVRYLRISLCS